MPWFAHARFCGLEGQPFLISLNVFSLVLQFSFQEQFLRFHCGIIGFRMVIVFATTNFAPEVASLAMVLDLKRPVPQKSVGEGADAVPPSPWEHVAESSSGMWVW